MSFSHADIFVAVAIFKVKVTAYDQNMTLSIVLSELLIPWQLKKVCLLTIHNNQTKYNKVGIYWQ